MDIAIYTFNSSTDTLPTFNDGYTYTYTDVDNGDSTITRTITSDSLPSSINFSGKTKLISLSHLDISNLTSMNSMFSYCFNLTSIDLSSFNTSNITDMSYMFDGCTNLTSLDVSDWDTSKVTSMSNMFNSCTNLTSIDVSNWDTSKVTIIAGMFRDCSNLTSLDLSNFNTSQVTSMYSMFYNCSNLTSLDLSNFNTSQVTSMSSMFKNCSNLSSINIDNSNVDSINDIIAQLPTRTADSYGTMTVSEDILSSVDNTTANSKYWNIKIPKYSFTLDTLKYLLTTIKSKFITKEEMNNKIDKVEGKQLSSNNFSNEDVNNINNSFNDAELNQNGTTISFYSTSIDGTKTKIKDIDLDI